MRPITFGASEYVTQETSHAGNHRPLPRRHGTAVMRAADVFAAGAIAGAVVVWLWGRHIENFLGEKTRDARTQADHPSP